MSKFKLGAPPGNRMKTTSADGASPALSRDVIIAAALDQIDRNGLEAFSVRKLAKKLKVYPAALTWHVPGRNDLLAQVVAFVLADIQPTAFPISWQSYLRQVLVQFREAIRRHPNVAPLIGSQLLSNLGINFDFVERCLAALAHAGFSGPRLVGAYNAVIAALAGFALQEFAPLPTDKRKAWQKEMSDLLRTVQPSKFPILAANLEAMENKAFILRWKSGAEAPMDEGFEFFVDMVIAGLEKLASMP